MKKILITGEHSFIGTSFTKYLIKYGFDYIAYTLDMTDSSWREKDFSKYDVVFHVAGIAHHDEGRVNDKIKALYYKVNTDLAIETAKKAKADGVKQFIFMSSSIVYKRCTVFGDPVIITKDTAAIPGSIYGDSKLQAEKGIIPLQDDKFKVVILRPPMIYGVGCKGNYPILSTYARHFHLFPDVYNQRSMLYVGNLAEFVRLMIENEESGIFYPQNSEYVKTSEMVKLIAEVHGRKVKLTKVFNKLIAKLGNKIGLINKVFGNYTYDMSMSEYKENYRICDFKESIARSEGIHDIK